MAITGNKGEWSEIYALFKLLGDGIVHAGDASLNKIEELFYPILSVIRNEQDRLLKYSIDGDLIVVTHDGNELLRRSISDFIQKATELLSIIQSKSGVFSAPNIESFMSDIQCSKLKAKSQDKTDIRIVIHDLRTGMTPELGFSIKSQLGNSSTLLNAGKTTNFCYRIKGCQLTDSEIRRINSISTRQKILDRVTSIVENHGILEYIGMDDKTFENNLILIDSFLPQIIAAILAQCYSTGIYDLKRNTEDIARINPMRYDTSHNHQYYEHKIKNLLVASALGMVPHTPWNGLYDANGGYLVVKEDGDVLCYHFYDRNLFEGYLYENTRFETPSSSRYGFGEIFKGDDGNNYFKLNLQIRFK